MCEAIAQAAHPTAEAPFDGNGLLRYAGGDFEAASNAAPFLH